MASTVETALISQAVKEQRGRIVRNITANTIHISSIECFSDKEVSDTVNIGFEATRMVDPQKIADELKNILEKEPQTSESTALRIALEALLKRDVKETQGEFKESSAVHRFLLRAAVAAANDAASNLSLLPPGITIQYESQFHNRYYPLKEEGIEPRELKSVCAAPQLARKWVEAAEEGFRLARRS